MTEEQEWRTAFASALRRLRKLRGYSQEGMAHDMGLARSHASKLERGRATPMFMMLVRLADFLGLTVSGFMREIEKEQQKLKQKRRPSAP